eukprot:Hpha_TRINITY_DN30560_c0_g1::TRINITY_DN30560_c0_g1_i1::g.193603::m.193603
MAGEEVRLYVYALTCPPWLRCMGFGAWHAGIAVYGTEYSYVHQRGSGLLRSRPGAAFSADRLHEEKVIGRTKKSKEEVRALLREMEKEWRGRDFDSIHKNCCHFAEEFAYKLGRFSVPGYVNRAANCASCIPRECMDKILDKWFERRRQQKHLLKEKLERELEEARWRPALKEEVVVERTSALRARSPGGRWRPLTVVAERQDGTYDARAAQPDGSAGDDWEKVPLGSIECNWFRVGDRVVARDGDTIRMEDGWTLRYQEVATVAELDEDGDFTLKNSVGLLSTFQFAKGYKRLLDYSGGPAGPAALSAAVVISMVAAGQSSVTLPGVPVRQEMSS